MPRLGKADHKLVHLVSRYKPIVKRIRPIGTTIHRWDDDALEQLRGTSDCTDWDVFVNNYTNNLDELTQTVSDYINFCVEVTVPIKQTKVFSNNKLWIKKSKTCN
ncbi:hypothetical protein HOLleu_38252 [Holothuria leucospilota]|uniref:Uncharacterized protein n=1 Tax=Holothuria leucospilota TaxID=206669 RepID=A0A9Q1BCZ3_HOLLE|nr:hypothetical protein HOLleu_38252 [Holothuria leucospilota]